MSQILLLNAHVRENTATAMDAKWDESKHPRKHGQFAPKGTGTVGKSSATKGKSDKKASGGSGAPIHKKSGLVMSPARARLEAHIAKYGHEKSPAARASYNAILRSFEKESEEGRVKNKGLVKSNGSVTPKGKKAFTKLCNNARRKLGLSGSYEWGLNSRHGRMYVPMKKAKDFAKMAQKAGIHVDWNENLDGDGIAFSIAGQKYDW